MGTFDDGLALLEQRRARIEQSAPPKEIRSPHPADVRGDSYHVGQEVMESVTGKSCTVVAVARRRVVFQPA